MKRLYFVLMLLLLAVTATGVAVAQDDQVLVIGHAEATDSLDPARGYNQTTGIINKATYDTLVTFPDDGADEILPLLATDWTISEDGLSYTFNLREGVTFSSGNPLTAADVAYSINRLKYIQGSPSFLAANVTEVTADGDSTVTITLATVDPAFLSKLTNSAFGIVDSVEVAANGGSDAQDAATADTAEEFLNSTSAGTGPYVLEGWEPQVETVLVRNESYWGEAPFFDRIIIQNLPEAASQKTALEAGDIDLALDMTADQLPSIAGNADLAVLSSPGNIVHFLLMNRNAETCGDAITNPQVQEAVRLALDYPGYLELYSGITPASPTGVALYTGYGADHASVRDLDAARALLAEAGFADGFDVTMDYPIFTFQGVNMETVAQKIQADLAEVGINVTLNGGELQVALEGYRTGQNCLGYWFWGPDILDSVDALSFVAGGKVAVERALWTPDIADAEINDLYNQALVETDPDTRAELFTAIYDYLQDNGPWAPFLQPDVHAASLANIEGYIWHPQWLLDVALLSRAE